MASKLQAEVDALRTEVQALSQAVRELQTLARDVNQVGASDPSQNAKLAPAHELTRLARERGFAGLISYVGTYESGKRGYQWVTDTVPAEDLLDQDDTEVAHVLAALGNRQRLILLKAILKQPATVSELVSRLGMGTTGQVYHHLRSLQAADLITQEERGLFVFKGHRAQGLLMVLAGVGDLLNPRHSVGNWETETSDLDPSESPTN